MSNYRSQLAGLAVSLAQTTGKLQESQKEWALEYFTRDPAAFVAYIENTPQHNDYRTVAYIAHLKRSVQKLEVEIALQYEFFKRINSFSRDLPGRGRYKRL